MTAASFSNVVTTVDLNRTPHSRPIRVMELRTADSAGGGPEKTIFNGAKLSDPSEFDIRVVYLRKHNDECSHLRERAAAHGISYREIRTRGPFDWGALQKLRGLVAIDQPAILHVHDYKSCFLAWLVARNRKLRLLATAHGWTGSLAREKYLYYPAERFILRRFHHIVSVSSQITQRLISSGVHSRMTTTIPNGIEPRDFSPDRATRDEERSKLALQSNQFVIGAVGRLEKQKRFDLLIEAFARTRADYPDNVLLIAGDGSLKSQLQNQIDLLGIASHCRLIGHVANIEKFYNAIDLFVQSSDYEGTPNVVLEAMAMRVPVIATCAGGTDDVLRHEIDGIIVPTGSVERIANAILAVRRDWDNTLSRVETARRRVETELSFATRNERLESIYRSLLASPIR